MSGTNHLKRQLTRYKDLLANLSRRNRELYYRESKGSTINLSRQPFSESSFVPGTTIKFSPLKFSNEIFSKILKGDELDLSKHFQIEDIKDAETARRLNNKLDKIRVADDRHQREYGISGAWVLGPFLCWRSSAQATKDDLLISPILKVPVDLKKNKRKNIELIIEDETLTINPSLRLCLKQMLGLEISEGVKFEEVGQVLEHLTSELNKINKSVSKASDSISAVPKLPGKFKIIKDENGEIIDRVPVILEEILSTQDLEIYNKVTSTEFILIDVMYLDQLNASRMVLINDYDGIIEEGLDHPILNELFNGTPLAEEPVSDRSKLKELDAYKERANHFVVDIDSTQHRAIDKATKSSAIVIQGPPGTGKSQTIVNLIADYLAKGKKVLFVSEKRPALDVVFNRMKSANIESQAVLIHSSDLNKSDLYCSFLELANSTPSSVDEHEWESISTSLDQVKSDINQYAAALQQEYPGIQLSAAEVIMLSSSLEKELFNIDLFNAVQKYSYEQIKKIGLELNEIQKIFSNIPNMMSSPWINRKQQTMKSISLEHALIGLRETLKSLHDERIRLESTIREITKIEIIPDMIISIIQPRMSVDEISANSGPLWENYGPNFKEALPALVIKLKKAVADLELNISLQKTIAIDAQPDAILALENYYGVPRGFTDWFSSFFWAQRKLRNRICPVWDGTNRQFVGYRLYNEAIRELSRIAPTLSLDPLNLKNHGELCIFLKKKICEIESLHRFFIHAQNSLPKTMLDCAISSFDGFYRTLENIKTISQCWDKILACEKTANLEFLKIGLYVESVPSNFTGAAAVKHLDLMIDRLDELSAIDRFDIAVSKIAERYAIPKAKDLILKFLIGKKEKWADIIEASSLMGWADEILSKSEMLRTFDRKKIIDRVAEFRSSAEQHKVTSRQAVHQSFAKRWATVSDRSGVPLLKKESAKQRRVLSPREIMEKGALGTMLQLKPCWLMSPLSISQMLPLQKGLFDVIIFDEASQVRVEDAVPSIFRAATMIVVGDNKQMPPTSFFSGAIVDDDDEEEEISPSVLDLASQVYPSVLLEWHYRSRAESLIAFSNRAFYGGRLIAAPNPTVLTASGALKYIEVPNAYFTSKSGNLVEAEAIVDHLLKLLAENANRSYGVIAMGQSQAVAIDEVITKRIIDDAHARSLIEKAIAFKDGDSDAGLFIKNLENVQGDERDVIIMSVGYAPSAEGKKLVMNFGPLSKQGGGRRLNVAITRAKSQMYIFSSFSPMQLPTDEETFNRNPDLCVLGRYLKYAHAVSSDEIEVALGILNSFGMSGAITSRKASRFSMDVKRRLEELGYQVSSEIGSSGFFIDLGIHHPILNSNFIIGIECDGAIFHSTPYARDRDKIREDLLKSRGWRIERVYSQDWSNDWRKEILRLDAKIKIIVAQSEEFQPFSKVSNS